MTNYQKKAGKKLDTLVRDKKHVILFLMAERSYLRTRGNALSGHRTLMDTIQAYESQYGFYRLPLLHEAFEAGK